ncbi:MULTISPECIES: EAL domain-containing protein [Serratia]|uniref:EAL domain-containing protein n=1 Tax=Serratia TaxID=613 RepID=UPI000BFFBCC7|nr:MULTISPECIES: EAL domain-containing protein [Serratia]
MNPELKSLSHSSNAISLNYLGAGSVNLLTYVSTIFEVVKIDKILFSTQFYRNSFPVLLKDIIKYCPRIIVSGVFDTELLQHLKEWGVWGVQGDLYKSALLQDASGLI